MMKATARLGMMLAASTVAMLAAEAAAQTQDTPDGTQAPATTQATTATPITEATNPQQDVVVTGTRGALESAERAKRDAPVTIDEISADDIGALPDESIADSLVRVPGLTANDNENGFAEVSVRGLGADLANTTYNGRVLPSTRIDTRRLNLGDLPTEGIQRAFVQKTAQASTIEGGLAGTVGLESIHPLETRRRGLQLVGRAITDDVSQDIKGVYGYKPWGYRGEATYVGRLTDRFGVAVSYAHIQQTNAAPSTQLVNYMTRTITPDADGDKLFDAIPNNAGVNMGATNQKRDSVLAMVQWRPTDALTASLDGYYIDSIDDGHPVNFISMNNATANKAPTTYDVVDSVVRHYVGYTGLYQETVQDNHTNTRQLQGGFNLKFDNGGPFSAVFDVSYAQARVTGENLSAIVRTLPNDAKRTVAGQIRPFSFDDRDPKNITLDFGAQSPTDYMLTEIDEGNPFQNDTIKAGRLDFHYDRPLSIIGSMDFGLKVDGRVKDAEPDGNAYTFGGLTTNPALDATYLAASPNPLAKIANYLGGAGAVTFPLYDLAKLLALESNPKAVYNTQAIMDARNKARIGEDTLALYYQANLAAGSHLTGNVGVRYFITDETIDGFNIANATATPAAVEIKHSYHYFLPSLNLRYAPVRSLVIRAALSKTMSRPIFSAIRIGTAIDFSTLLPGATITRGNPDLKPFTSKNADLGVEWYPSKAMTFAVQGFYKSVTNFITDSLVSDTVVSPSGASIPVFINTSINDPTKRYFAGIEVIARRDFDFLPGPLRNLGLRLDYSHNWTDAIQQYASLDKTQVSLTPNNFTPSVLNAQLYYTAGRTDVRLAYRYYSPYVRENSNGYQSRPDGTLDLSGSVGLYRGIRAIAIIRNLTKSYTFSTLEDYRYPDAYGLPRNVIYPGRSVTFGLRAGF